MFDLDSGEPFFKRCSAVPWSKREMPVDVSHAWRVAVGCVRLQLMLEFCCRYIGASNRLRQDMAIRWETQRTVLRRPSYSCSERRSPTAAALQTSVSPSAKLRCAY